MNEIVRPILTTWQSSVTKKSGQLRRQFAWWKVPANIVLMYGLSDGHRHKLTIRMSTSGKATPEVIGTYDVLMTSGNELYLPVDARRAIQERANAESDSLVYFEMTVFAPLRSIEDDLEQQVQKSLEDSSDERQKRLASAETIPERIRVWATAFRRNPDVIAEVLSRANGVCQSCGADAPFFRASNGQPYLEVHHKKRLADGGKDTLDNAIALCPNCHRKEHHGALPA